MIKIKKAAEFFTVLGFIILIIIMGIEFYTTVLQQELGKEVNQKIDENLLLTSSVMDASDGHTLETLSFKVDEKNKENTIEKAGDVGIVMVLCFGIFISYIFLIEKKANKVNLKHLNQLEKIAFVDELTGARNYNKFKKDAQQILENEREQTHTLIKLDIENFKLINQLYGYKKGDEILRAVIKTVEKNLQGENEICARIGTDEFLVLLGLMDHKNIEDFREKFYNSFYAIMGNEFTFNVKFLFGYYIKEGKREGNIDILDMFEKANIAHRVAKQNPALDYVSYSKSLMEKALQQKEIEDKMERALEDEEFLVYLQPKYYLSNEAIGGVEALVRWKNEDNDIFNPDTFIPIFEKNGFVIKLDMYMLSKVCEIIKGWIADGIEPVKVSVNFSRLHLSNTRFVEDLCKIVDEKKIPRKYIEIELTETAIFENLKVIEDMLSNLHNAGFTLSMDDFGSGYSSLGLLKNLPVDVIKLDRSFFCDEKYKSRTKIVVGNIIRMTRELGIYIVAEGVETVEHIAYLRELKCDMVQGYYYAKPMLAEKLELKTWNIIPPLKKDIEQIFKMSLIGDVKKGRGNFGEEMPVTIYRLFHYTMREVLSTLYGKGEMIEAFRRSGRMAGRTFSKETLDFKLPFMEFMDDLKQKLEESKIGTLDIEMFDETTGKIVLIVRDDLDCAGVPNTGEILCNYDEGFIEGILYEYTQKNYSVVEVDCWGTGADLCRFEVRPR